MDDQKPGAPLNLVADNSAGELKKQRALQEFEWAEEQANDAVRQLAINLLRIIAGAGEPWSLLRNIDEARTRYVEYLEAAKSINFRAEPPTKEVDLDRLFSETDRERIPETEEEWLRWAKPVTPYEEYRDSKRHAKQELRRAVLRQVASVLSSGESREPSLKAHGGNLDDIVESIFVAKGRLQQERARPLQVDPYREGIAKQKISELRKQQRRRQIELLPSHQIDALRSVNALTLDEVDSFTLDVLGRMNLLARPVGNKKKSAWQLTEDGRLALDIHNKSNC